MHHDPVACYSYSRGRLRADANDELLISDVKMVYALLSFRFLVLVLDLFLRFPLLNALADL